MIGCDAVKAQIRSPAIVEVWVTADRGASLADAVVGLQIHLLVFGAAPQPLDEHFVAPGALAIHADRNAVVGEHAGEGCAARELAALIGADCVRLGRWALRWRRC